MYDPQIPDEKALKDEQKRRGDRSQKEQKSDPRERADAAKSTLGEDERPKDDSISSADAR